MLKEWVKECWDKWVTPGWVWPFEYLLQIVYYIEEKNEALRCEVICIE